MLQNEKWPKSQKNTINSLLIRDNAFLTSNGKSKEYSEYVEPDIHEGDFASVLDISVTLAEPR